VLINLALPTPGVFVLVLVYWFYICEQNYTNFWKRVLEVSCHPLWQKHWIS